MHRFRRPLLSMALLSSTLLLAACTGGRGPAGQLGGDMLVDVVLGERVATVPTVSWSASQGEVQRAWIDWGTTESYGHRVAVDLGDDPDFHTSVLGMRPNSLYHLRVQAETAERTLDSGDVTVATGPLVGTLPFSVVDEPQPGMAQHGYLVTSVVVSPSMAVIFDAGGELVWAYEPSGVQMMGRAALSRDGTRVFMCAINLFDNEPGELISVSIDGTDEQRIPMAHLHHDFTELPDGSIAWLSYDPRVVDGQTVPGDRLMERAPDGTERQVYSVWDDFSPPPAGQGDSSPGSGPDVGWPHANAVDYLADRDAYLVSFLLMGTIVEIDRSTGTLNWVLGGDGSTMATPDGGTAFFDGEHQMELQDDRLLVFENGLDSGRSQAVELQLSPDRGLAEQSWSYSPSLPLSSPILGDVATLAGGNRLVTFSYNGQVHEVDEQGELVWRLSMGLGGALGFLTDLETLQPTGEQ